MILNQKYKQKRYQELFYQVQEPKYQYFLLLVKQLGKAYLILIYSIRGVTKKGKEFFKLDTSHTEAIRSLHV
jgi:hypothetical protein